MLKINKNLTTVNFTKMTNRTIKYIVVHYTANNGDTAKANTDYFKSVDRQASAHYFVDENSIWQCVEDKNKSWHCGGGLQGKNGHKYYQICTNSNSIGIEMCSRKDSKGNYYIKDEVVNNTIDLIKYLMDTYKIPMSNVIRHYDVTGKICPAPFIDETKWNNFKKKLVPEITEVEDIIDVLVRFNVISDVTLWNLKLQYDQNCYWLARKSVNMLKNKNNANLQTINDIVWELNYRGIMTDKDLWIKKLNDDSNAYWLARKICNYMQK